MFADKGAVLYILAESPVHWGTGASLGAIDLPIQRERHTDYPVGQSAGVKGALRDVMEQRRPGEVVGRLFGPDTTAKEKHMGSLAFGDAKILLFPVRNLKGAFAWITCPFVLERLRSDLARAGHTVPPMPPVPGAGEAVTTAEGRQALEVAKDSALLEEQPFKMRGGAEAFAAWLQKSALPDGLPYHAKLAGAALAVIPDDDFRGFVKQCTVVETHVAIDDDTHTAKDGALFQAEFLPSDSLLYALVLGRNPADFGELAEGLAAAGGRAQMGADASVGRGLVALKLATV